MRALGGRAGFAALLAAYVLTHLLLRVWMSPTLTVDDAREAVFSQTLDWGYQPRQPPLYSWVVWAAVRVFGLGVPPFAAVRYAWLAVAALFLYLSARRILSDARVAALAAASPLLLLPFSWNIHFLTHTAALVAACGATLYALVRLLASGRSGAYAWLGVALGLGLLSKFNYALFAGSLLAAGLTIPDYRRRLLDPRLLLALGLAAILVLPYALWFRARGFPVGSVYSTVGRLARPEGGLASLATDLYHVLRVGVAFLGPVWAAFLLLAPEVLRPATAASRDRLRHGQLLARTCLLGAGILVAGAVLSDPVPLRTHWVLPVFLLVPPYLVWRLDVAGVEPRQVRRLGLAVAVAALAVAVTLLTPLSGASLLAAGLGEPYGAVAARLAEAGFRRGTIVAGRGALGGNLRVSFPTSRVVTIDDPRYTPPAGAGDGQCLVVWDREDPETVGRRVAPALAALEVDPGALGPFREIELPSPTPAGRTLRVRYALLERGAGRCR